MTMLRWGGWILLVCLTVPTAAQDDQRPFGEPSRQKVLPP